MIFKLIGYKQGAPDDAYRKESARRAQRSLAENKPKKRTATLWELLRNPYQTLSLAFPHIADMPGTAHLSSIGRVRVIYLSYVN